MNLSTPIKASKKNFNSVKAAVQAVHASHAQAISAMGGVVALSNVILAAILALPMATIGSVANAVEKALSKTVPLAAGFLANLVGCRSAIRKILELLT
jgi:hypothetical protein